MLWGYLQNGLMWAILSKFTQNPKDNHIFRFKTKWELKKMGVGGKKNNALVKMLNFKTSF